MTHYIRKYVFTLKLIVFLMLTLLSASCTAPQKVKTTRYFWPQLPDQPRIEWIKVYNSQLDLEKSTYQRFWDAVAGEDAPALLVKPVEVKSIPALNCFYVSDVGAAAVLVFDLEKNLMRRLVLPKGVAPFIQPSSIVTDADYNLYILEKRSASIHIFDKSEKYRNSLNLHSVSINKPVAMAIDAVKSLLYVADAETRAVYILDYKGTIKNKIVKGAGGDNAFILPIGIAINSKGNIHVADAFGVNIQIFDAEGHFLRSFGKRGDGAGDFQLIKSIAVDSSDNIYVVDGRSHNISILNQQGELLMILGGFYSSLETGKAAPGGFAVPVSIDIDPNDKIFVVDQMNTRVQVFQYFSEEYLRNTPVP